MTARPSPRPSPHSGRGSLVPRSILRFAVVALATIAGLLVLDALEQRAAAQSTGSRFGGSRFGGSSGSSGGGGSYGGSSRFGGTGWRGSGSWSTGGGGRGNPGLLPVAGLFAIGLVIVIFAARANRASSQPWTAGPVEIPNASWQQMDVTVLTFGIDWRARRALQEKLESLGKHGDTATSEGLVALLRQVVASLRAAEMSWLYAGAINASPMEAQQAEQRFRRATQDARSRFKHELRSDVDGKTSSEAAPALKAKSHEGEGVVVVTLAVAARRELRDVVDPTDAPTMREALKELSHVPPGELVALEVIWSPSAEQDRMSTAELEAFYPELEKIDESSIAGRVFCRHCQGPFAAELRECPHCGAPSGGAASP